MMRRDTQKVASDVTEPWFDTYEEKVRYQSRIDRLRKEHAEMARELLAAQLQGHEWPHGWQDAKKARYERGPDAHLRWLDRRAAEKAAEHERFEAARRASLIEAKAARAAEIENLRKEIERLEVALEGAPPPLSSMSTGEWRSRVRKEIQKAHLRIWHLGQEGRLLF